MSANAQTYIDDIIRKFAEIQTNLLLLSRESGATERQKFFADDLQEAVQEVENDELKALKESLQ